MNKYNNKTVIRTNILKFDTKIVSYSAILVRDFSTFSTQDTSSTSNVSLKENFVLKKWVTDFPNHSDLTYDDITKLASRSSKIGEWLKEANYEFQISSEVPSWFITSDERTWNEEMTAKLLFIKQIHSDKGPRIDKLAQKYKQDIIAINNESNSKMKKELEKNPELVIELFTTQILPIETHLKSMEFKTKEEARIYLKTELLNFKKECFSRFVSGDLSSTELINMLYSKQ